MSRDQFKINLVSFVMYKVVWIDWLFRYEIAQALPSGCLSPVRRFEQELGLLKNGIVDAINGLSKQMG